MKFSNKNDISSRYYNLNDLQYKLRRTNLIFKKWNNSMNLKASNLNKTLQPIDVASGLPNEHYVDQSVFDEEKQAVLFDNWVGIGIKADVPNEGDVFPVEFAGMPLLVVRENLNTVKVYQNTCRHRGMILIQEPGNVRGTIRCPYHSWCYGLDGELR